MTSTATIPTNGTAPVVAAPAPTQAEAPKAPASPTPAPQPTQEAQPAPRSALSAALSAVKEETPPVTEPEKPATETKSEGDGEKPAEAVPEKYEPYKVPDGVSLAPAVQQAFDDLARKAGLSQAKAQESFDSLRAAYAEQVAAEETALFQDWNAKLKADPEIGGDKLERETLPRAVRFVEAFGDPEARALLDGPLGSHPALVRMFAKGGAKLEEAPIVKGPHAGPATPTASDYYKSLPTQ